LKKKKKEKRKTNEREGSSKTTARWDGKNNPPIEKREGPTLAFG